MTDVVTQSGDSSLAAERMIESNACLSHPIPTRLNFTIVVGQLVATAMIFYGASIITAWWQVALLAIAWAAVGNSIYSVIHEAEHRMLHPNARVNDTLGAAMALEMRSRSSAAKSAYLSEELPALRTRTSIEHRGAQAGVVERRSLADSGDYRILVGMVDRVPRDPLSP